MTDMTSFKSQLPQWADGTNCAITVCDENCDIIYMNRRSQETFAKRGGAALIGHNLMDYHNDRSKEIIRRMLADGGINAYTIEKEGQHKLIYQTAWKKEDGTVGGLVEISMVIAPTLPHYIR